MKDALMMHLWRFLPPGPGEVLIAGAHDLRLVALSVAIAIAGALAMLRAVDRFRLSEARSVRRMWAAGGAISMGSGIWAMHFMGMIAFMLPVPMEYDFWLTAFSLVPAVAGSLAAVYVLGAPTLSSWRLHRGALVLGGSIGAMHYAGMEAMRFDGTLRYAPGLFLVSVGCAYALALLALLIRPLLKGSDAKGKVLRDVLSACLLGGAVAAMHYIAMAAATFYGITPAGNLHEHAPQFLMWGVISGMVMILAVVWVGSLVGRSFATIGMSLRRSEALNRAVIAAMRDAHFLADVGGRVVSMNPAASAMFGYTPVEVVGQNLAMLMPAPHREKHDGYIERYRTTRVPRIVGQPMRGSSAVRKDGTEFPIELVVTGFEVDGEQFYSGTVRDMSEHAASIENTKRLMAATDQAPDAFAILDTAMRVTYGNPSFWRATETTPGESLGRLLDEFAWAGADVSGLPAMHARIQAGKVWTGTVASTRADGAIVQESVTTAPVVADGGITCYIHIRRDITAQLRMEQHLRDAQKLESIGQLSAGIAHELNTPSQFVRDNIVFLKDGFAELLTLIEKVSRPQTAGDLSAVIKESDLEYLRQEIPKAIEQSIDGMSRITTIVRAMKEFSHQTKEKMPSNLNAAIESTITVATNEWKYVADITFDLDPALPLVPCVLDEFNQVILNIVVNAAHAIADAIDATKGEKGRITIETRAAGGFAEIRITDTGTGMTEQVKSKIFEPFFTTKEVGRGTGQGLSIAYAVVVKKHHGSIDVESEPGKGSSFVIKLPLAAQSGRETPAAA